MTHRPHDAGVRVFAPATIANLGPGFDVLGLALASPGDTVTARRSGAAGVRIARIDGDGGLLSTDPAENTAGIAAARTLHAAGIDAGVELELDKGLPIGSGLGSSAASAAAASLAVNLLFGSPLRKSELVDPCLDAEAAVAGRHADNVAPSLLGGLMLVRSVEPLDLVRLPVPEGLTVVVVTPEFRLDTKESRAVLPRSIELAVAVRHTARVAAMVAACFAGDLGLLARSMVDEIVTPARARLIPGCDAVIAAAIGAGALGSSISGSGPSIFALCRSARSAEEAARAMVAAFASAGLKSASLISPADCPGARRV